MSCFEEARLLFSADNQTCNFSSEIDIGTGWLAECFGLWKCLNMIDNKQGGCCSMYTGSALNWESQRDNLHTLGGISKSYKPSQLFDLSSQLESCINIQRLIHVDHPTCQS